MIQFVQMLNIQLSLVIFTVSGVLCYKLKIITENNRQQFINFILLILMPCMVFDSFKSVTIDILKEGVLALIISFGVCLLTIILGHGIYFYAPENQRNILRYGTLINNAGFAGLPIVQSMFGNNGLILASIFLIPIRIFMWSAGITMLSEESTSLKKICAQLIKNPSIIAVVLGLLRGLLEIPFPSFLETSIESLSSIVSPLAMIVIGSIIATIPLKGLLNKSIIWFSIVRLLLIPLGTLFLTSGLGFSNILVGTAVILTSMPAATTTALLAAQYDSDVSFASKLVFVTTIASIITSPVLMMLIG